MGERDKTLNRTLKIYLGIAILLFAGFGSVLATNISINPAVKTIEYGQGSYQLTSCDSWIKMDLINGATASFGAPDGFSPLVGISISSLDTKRCRGTRFTIRALDLHDQQLSLFRTDGQSAMCANLPCTPGVNSEDVVDLTINSQGLVALTHANSFHSLAFDSRTSVYTIEFLQPTILANDVGRLLIQSSNANED